MWRILPARWGPAWIVAAREDPAGERRRRGRRTGVPAAGVEAAADRLEGSGSEASGVVAELASEGGR